MRKVNLKVLFTVLGSVLVLGVVATGLYFSFNSNETPNDSNKITPEVIERLNITNDETALENVKSNVVRVINKIGNDQIIGSGFFISNGYLVTNSHVVDIKGDIKIQYSDGSESKASLISNDIASDVALLTVEKISAFAMNFGNTLDVKITDDLYAVGYAINLTGEASITKGILSARRSMAGIEYLQTDAAINNGFSGGPLLNKKGEVVGMNSLANDNATIGMSISSESLQNIINKLIQEKKANYLNDERPTNVLSSVLKEVGYEIDDIYDEWKYFHKGEDKPTEKVEKEEPKPVYIPSSNCELSYLGVKGYDIGWENNPGSVKFQLFFTNNENTLDLTVTTKDQKATYKVKDNANLQQTKDGTITIVVTAEDGNHKKEYYIVYHNVQSTIPSLSNVTISTGIGKNYKTNTNVLQYQWGFIDVDGMHIDGYYKINYLKVDLYACTLGEQCTEESQYILLNSYNLYQDYRVEKDLHIQLSEIKQLLNNGNYFIDGKNKIYSKATLYTISQGNYSYNSYHTISQ